MNRKYSLKKTKEIDRVFHLKKSVGSKYYAIYYGPGTSSLPQIAISISKKVGNAVKRNYEKRVLREIIRPELEYLKPQHYLIIIKKAVQELSYLAKKEEMGKLIKKMSMYKETK
ncbi:MAG: ribonuclease P protein component [Bacilli bacterium]|nr:ribonuclease P protein component [Bacilli bacterium]